MGEVYRAHDSRLARDVAIKILPQRSLTIQSDAPVSSAKRSGIAPESSQYLTYRSSDDLGLYEFLLWAEDMNAEPLLAVYAGYSLKGVHVNPGPDLEPYVQDALDEIEYVTGPAASKWGRSAPRPDTHNHSS